MSVAYRSKNESAKNLPFGCMEHQFSRKDVYLLLIMSRWWRERPIEEYERTSYDRFLELGGLDSDSSRYPTLALELAKRILAIVKSYPPEESDEESDIEAGSEGDESDSSDEDEGILRQTE